MTMQRESWGAAWFGAVLASGLGWILLFTIRLSGVPDVWWRWRDDAVITLSASLNAARFGSIGPSPGGSRVEDFSSPLQFLVALVAFAVHPISYGAFLDWSVGLSLGITGGLVALIVYHVLESPGSSERNSQKSAIVSFIASTVVALGTLASWTATGWLVSGMENSLILLLGVSVAWLATRELGGIANTAAFAIALALLGMARTELPPFMVPLLAGVALLVWNSTEPSRRKLAVMVLIGVPIGSWLLLTVFRLIYFGHLFPNTALVEGKTIGVEQLVILALATIVYLIFAIVAVLGLLGDKAKRWTWRAVGLGSALSAFAIAVLPVGHHLDEMALVPILALLLSIAMLGIGRLDSGTWTVDLVFAGIVFIPIAQVAVMGPARLDPFRVASLAVPFLAVWLAATFARLLAIRSTDQSTKRSLSQSVPRWAVIGVGALLICVGAMWAATHDRSRDLCCVISPSQTRILNVSDPIQKSALGGTALPIVANPDLGKISFAKRAIIEDLGWLGDPLLARIYVSRPGLVSVYLNQVAMPDVVEIHDAWSCDYASWTNSVQFGRDYVVVPPNWKFQPSSYKGCPRNGTYTIWKRTNAANEYRLTRAISQASRPENVVKRAISGCRGSGTEVFRCEYVRRAILRNAQMLIDRGLLGSVVAGLKGSPSATFDIALIEQRPDWDAQAYSSFVRLAEPNPRKQN